MPQKSHALNINVSFAYGHNGNKKMQLRWWKSCDVCTGSSDCKMTGNWGSLRRSDKTNYSTNKQTIKKEFQNRKKITKT